MTDNTDNQSLGNFSIQDTMEMGMGSQQLLNDLMSPETSTGSPDDLQPIVKEIEPTTSPAQGKPKGKEIVQKEEGEQLTGAELISNFLGSEDDENEEEEIVPQVVKPKIKSTVPIQGEEDEEQEVEVTQFTALANDLYKLGVFTSEEDEEVTPVNTPEEFLEKFNFEKKKGAIEIVNNFIGQFGEDYQQAFDAIFVKGVDPKEYFNVFNNVAGFAELDLSLEDNQERVLRQALADQGFDAEDVTSEIERLRNYGDLESVAGKHHKVLIKKEAAKLQQLEATASQELQAKNAVKNQYINNVQSIIQEKLKEKSFDGIPINPKLAYELQDFLLVDKYKTASGETITDFDKAILEMKRPENHATKVKVALLLKILEKDPTLSTIQKTGITKKSDALFGEVARQVTKTKTTASGAASIQPKSWFSQ